MIPWYSVQFSYWAHTWRCTGPLPIGYNPTQGQHFAKFRQWAGAISITEGPSLPPHHGIQLRKRILHSDEVFHHLRGKITAVVTVGPHRLSGDRGLYLLSRNTWTSYSWGLSIAVQFVMEEFFLLLVPASLAVCQLLQILRCASLWELLRFAPDLPFFAILHRPRISSSATSALPLVWCSLYPLQQCAGPSQSPFLALQLPLDITELALNWFDFRTHSKSVV